uniref:Uncharacterized protein n=1 Tax=Chelativorans sp. (strain BNC1) TaxID=266779 RepID=Q11DY7_CHESB
MRRPSKLFAVENARRAGFAHWQCILINIAHYLQGRVQMLQVGAEFFDLAIQMKDFASDFRAATKQCVYSGVELICVGCTQGAHAVNSRLCNSGRGKHEQYV